MKIIYNIVEFTLIFALIMFGQESGTSNIWYMFSAIIATHLVLEFLYRVRRYSERHTKKIKKDKDLEFWKNLTPEGKLAESNALITHRDFYDDVKNH